PRLYSLLCPPLHPRNFEDFQLRCCRMPARTPCLNTAAPAVSLFRPKGLKMGDSASAPGQIIALPKGGGAQRGLGETFSPDLQSGTGNFTVPVTLPAGRNGF